MDTNGLLTFLVIGIVLIFIFLLIRELHCWYWKINARLNALEKIHGTLGDIKRALDNIERSIERK